jgi:phosphatidylserine/phosphatidylglycerophosphate/cardiolipin synthase-like enzyme
LFPRRWDDPARSAAIRSIFHDLLRRIERKASVLPRMAQTAARNAVQVRASMPPHGATRSPAERSVARGFRKAVGRARRLIYIEDQFLWSRDVANVIASALVASPSLHLVVVLPRFFDQASALTLRPNQVGREQAVRVLLDAAGDRVAIYDIENADCVPVYVHAKISIIDDVWASVGSDNFNRRSWSHDSEIACAVIDEERDVREPIDPAALGDGARKFARDLRLQLWREHLGREDGDDEDLLDPREAVAKFKEAALAVERWHQGGRQGARPPGNVRPHPRIQPSRLTRLWAEPMYRTIYDPDARTRKMRRLGEW